MTDTYEAIRDSNIVPPDVREAVIRSEHARRGLQETYQSIQSDPDLTTEAKARLADEAHQKHKDGIVEKNQTAREGLLKTVKSKEKAAVPTPKGVSLTTDDPTRLLLIQGEAERIRRIAEKRGDHPLGGGGRVGDYLKSEYARAVNELSGAEAQAVAAGTLRAAVELGVSEEEIVSPLRTDQQRELLDEARRLEYMSGMFSKEAPKPPKELSRQVAQNRRREMVQRTRVFMPESEPTELQTATEPSHSSGRKRKPSWK